MQGENRQKYLRISCDTTHPPQQGECITATSKALATRRPDFLANGLKGSDRMYWRRRSKFLGLSAKT